MVKAASQIYSILMFKHMSSFVELSLVSEGQMHNRQWLNNRSSILLNTIYSSIFLDVNNKLLLGHDFFYLLD